MYIGPSAFIRLFTRIVGVFAEKRRKLVLNFVAVVVVVEVVVVLLSSLSLLLPLL